MADVFYFSREDLEDALGLQVVRSIYDDELAGNANPNPIISCCRYGTSECNSFLRAIQEGITLPLSPVPDEVRYAALDFGIAYTMRRRPDLVRAMGEESWTAFRDAAVDKMKRYVDGVQQMPREQIIPDMGPQVDSDCERGYERLERDRRGERG